MVPPRVKPGSFPTSTSGAVVSSSVPSVFAASVVTDNMVVKGELELAMMTSPSISVYRNGKGTNKNGHTIIKMMFVTHLAITPS